MEDKEYNKINFMDDVSEIYAKFPMAILNEQANQMAGEWQNLSVKYVYKMQSKIDTLEQELSKANDKLKKIEEYLTSYESMSYKVGE
ncbi:MAG TPA: hypothetical protein GX708_16715 [Gallicola sp.]|nr:hypothetical protein [Gallicola sp.]